MYTPGNHFFTANGRFGTMICKQKESMKEAMATEVIASFGNTPVSLGVVESLAIIFCVCVVRTQTGISFVWRDLPKLHQLPYNYKQNQH